ncbi:hypothetical protein JCM10207_001567 [Rhodosporidiobolus poonsookiae]
MYSSALLLRLKSSSNEHNQPIKLDNASYRPSCTCDSAAPSIDYPLYLPSASSSVYSSAAPSPSSSATPSPSTSRAPSLFRYAFDSDHDDLASVSNLELPPPSYASLQAGRKQKKPEEPVQPGWKGRLKQFVKPVGAVERSRTLADDLRDGRVELQANRRDEGAGHRNGPYSGSIKMLVT